jgi:hypothetical protein
MIKRRALLLYATMTKNTEKVAVWFRETFEKYGWEVTFVRIKAKMDWPALQDKLYFDDYDLILLGSPIVGGEPLQSVIKVLSFGGGGNLEKEVQDKIDSSAADAAAPPMKMDGPEWTRTRGPSPGMPNHSGPRPYGVVFTTYGGGFFGVNECVATIELLKLYLGLHNVDVIGKFSCAGKETGPAGYPLGVKPKKMFIPGKRVEGPDADVCDAVMYTMGDGTQVPGSYFFHYDCDSKPGPREEARARAFISDIIEDYFMTFDGKPNPPISEIISMS